MNIAPANLVGYWPMDEASGTAAVDAGGHYNGTHNAGVTVAAGTFINGDKSPTMAGAGVTNVYSAGFSTAFPRNEGTLSLWLKMPTAGQWVDGTLRYFACFYAGATENIQIICNGGVTYLNYRDSSGTKSTYQSALITTAWVNLALTWSVTSGIAAAYVNGYPLISVPSVAGVTGFSTALNASFAVFGALRSNATSGMIGGIAHAGLWSKPFTQPEILRIVSPLLSERGMLYIGDSKSSGDDWLFYLPQLRNATGNYNHQSISTATGISGATVATGKATVLAAISASTREAHYCTLNYGANDVGSMPVEATWKADMREIIDAVRAKWPNCKIYVVKPWRRNFGTECNTLAGWVDAIIAAYPAGVYLGHDERTWMKGADDGATMTLDGIHYSAAGQTECAAQFNTAFG